MGGALTTGGPGVVGMWAPLDGLIPEAGPTGIIPGEGGPILGIMAGPPLKGPGIIPGRGGLGSLGGGGIMAQAGGGAENEGGGILLKCRGGFVGQALSLLSIHF